MASAILFICRFLGLLEHDVSDLRGAMLSIPPYPECGHTKLFLLEPDGGDNHSTGSVCPYVQWQNCCHPDSRLHDQIPGMEGNHWNMLPHGAIILISPHRANWPL